MRRAFVFFILLAVSCLMTGTSAVPLLLAQGAVSPDEAAAIAGKQTGGRVLGVEWGEGAGGPVYQVKVLKKDGSVTKVPVPARGKK
ncbi:MAG TPA: PepSY domain-containing protein [Gammaproteobacteria bacterium]|nr:PepSY domain-containing protein [Gammaproteobacteria bacterium]